MHIHLKFGNFWSVVVIEFFTMSQKSGKKKFDADKDIDTSECPTATTPKSASPAKKSVAAVADKKAKKVLLIPSLTLNFQFIITLS